MITIKKYPRTHHIETSRLQPGDEDMNSVAFRQIANRHLVIEEKVDGANAGISFTEDGQLLLQSRGHYLTGGYRERHFNLFKTWAYTYVQDFWKVLGSRYIMYGEWLYAKHTMFYTDLPHYFMEFDIYDKEEDVFLSTERRRVFWAALPFLVPVRILHEGKLKKLKDLLDFVETSAFINDQHLNTLTQLCEQKSINVEKVLMETDRSSTMEGLYIKVEENGEVIERYKWVRYDFMTTILNSHSHWQDRPIVPNQLAAGVKLF